MLQSQFLGNTVLEWSIALVALVLAAGALIGAQQLVARWLRRRRDRAHPHGVDVTLGVLEATQPLLLLIVAVWVGAQFVELPRKPDRFVDHLAALAMIVQAALWTSRGLRVALADYFERKRETDAGAATTAAVLSFLVQLALWAVVAMLALENLGFSITTLIAGLGVGGIAVALAAQSVLGDLFASVIIALDRPFAIGDAISAGDATGTVEHVGFKSTTLLSPGGEQLIVANADLLKSRIHNYKRQRERRVEFSFEVSYDTPAEKLSRIPGLVREAVEAQPMTRFDRAHFKSYGDLGVTFEVAFFVETPDYNRYMDIRQAINLAIYTAFQQRGVAIARAVPALLAGEPPDNGERPRATTVARH